MSLLKAHIFKKRSRGEREEVEIKLFNMDGTDAVLGGAGGGTSKALRVRSSVSELIESENGENYPVPFGDIFVLHKEGFEFDPGDMSVPAEQGVYVVQFEPMWTGMDGAANSGSARCRLNLQYVDPDDENTYYDELVVSEFFAPYSSDQRGGRTVGIAIVNEPNAAFTWEVSQSAQELGMSFSGLLIIAKL